VTKDQLDKLQCVQQNMCDMIKKYVRDESKISSYYMNSNQLYTAHNTEREDFNLKFSSAPYQIALINETVPKDK
jgi:hypothetical protein